MATANKWSKIAALFHIRTHLQDCAHGCGNYNPLEEMFKAFLSRYELSIREASTRLTNLWRDTKLSLTDQATDVKRLVKAAYADLPWAHQEEMMLDLFCSSLNHTYLNRYLLAINPQSPQRQWKQEVNTFKSNRPLTSELIFDS